MLTIQILVKNNEFSIEKCLRSLPKNCKLIIGDLGSQDKTIQICRNFTNKIVDVSKFFDYAKARKHLLDVSETDWNFILNPWEVIFSGNELLQSVNKNKKNLKISIVQGDVLFQEIRIVNKKFKFELSNPAFEIVEGLSDTIPVYLASTGRQDLDYVYKILDTWKKTSPLSSKATYYLACANLSLKNWDNFLNYAKLYTSKEKESNMSKIMMHYYIAMVNLYVKNDFQDSIKNLIFCIAKKPSMAEFWCLLGDIFYATNNYSKANFFYEAAEILGSQRLNNDDWPIEISRYKEYPEKMRLNCNKLIESSESYFSDNQ